ncbi:MAG TPA: ATP synthase F0 subunit C [Acidobacteriota bacterium]|jgi:F-type H+-transporting ATPase subunit c|nr:ATP synthase F0 subunit C [Acidobacteriota bacterium]
MGRKSVLIILISVILLAFVIPAFAQGDAGAVAAKGKSQWLIIASAFGMALAAAGCGYAQSRALAAACEGVSRNPGATDIIRLFLILGLAFIEFLALLTFVVILMLQ